MGSPPGPLKLNGMGRTALSPLRRGSGGLPPSGAPRHPPTPSTAASGVPLPRVCPDGQATGCQVGTRQGPGVGWVPPRGPRPAGLRGEVSLTRRAGEEPGSLRVKAPGDRRIRQAGQGSGLLGPWASASGAPALP